MVVSLSAINFPASTLAGGTRHRCDAGKNPRTLHLHYRIPFINRRQPRPSQISIPTTSHQHRSNTQKCQLQPVRYERLRVSCDDAAPNVAQEPGDPVWPSCSPRSVFLSSLLLAAAVQSYIFPCAPFPHQPASLCPSPQRPRTTGSTTPCLGSRTQKPRSTFTVTVSNAECNAQ